MQFQAADGEQCVVDPFFVTTTVLSYFVWFK